MTSHLDRAGFAVDHAPDGTTALARAAAEPPDLVVLEISRPGLDGLEVCRRLLQHSRAPVLVLTTPRGEESPDSNLADGPRYSPRQLISRVESALRGTAPPPEPAASQQLCGGGITLDRAARAARDARGPLRLTQREFDLLAHFLRYPARVFSREELMRNVWRWEFGDLSTVTVHVRRLRHKVETDPTHPKLISTVWGLGYRFDGEGGAR